MFEGTEQGGVLDPALDEVRRALIMAGGGLKVAFQAGVLQVWLDEAAGADGEPLTFMHADGASGGVFNLAMWCQGMSGRRIAENWRRFAPLTRGVTLNRRPLESVFTMERFRQNVLFGTWRLNWPRIRATDRSASFNVFDVDDQRLRVVPPSEMSEDMLVAAVSLPFWYPPTKVRGRTYIDGVFVTDANLDAAIGAGANELWLPWTVSTRGRWRNGPVAQYFQVIEAAANGVLQRDLDRIARSNVAHEAGEPAEFPHKVRVLPLVAEVPIHYLFVFTRRSVAKAVDLGVHEARKWCRDRGIALRPVRPGAGPDPVPPGIRFRERMSGPVAFGRRDAVTAAQIGQANGDRMTLRLDAQIPDLKAFGRCGNLVELTGSVDCPALGGERPVDRGTLTLLPGAGRHSTMEYRLDFADGTGRELTLVGVKDVRDDPGLDLWRDTTTLDVSVVPRAGDGPRERVLTGRLRLSAWSLLRLLTTMRGAGPAAGPRFGALTAFLRFFLRRLLEIYRGPAAAPLPSDAPWPAGHRPDGAAVYAHNERVVPASPERVWDLLVDARGWSRYYPNARFVRLAGDDASGLATGTTFRWITFGVPIVSDVDLCEPHRWLGWTWRGRGARGYHVWHLEPDPAGTRIVTEETQRGPLPRLFRPVLRRLLPAGHDLWLCRLAERAARP